MQITWLGTASLLIESEGENLLIDPFVELTGGTNPNVFSDFLGYDTVLITHGHFDHLYFVPELIDQGETTVLCTETPANTLEKYTENAGLIAVIKPGMEFPLKNMRVRTFQGRHIRFKWKFMLKELSPAKLLKAKGNIPFLFWANKAFQENGETLVYEISAEGKKVVILGSLNLDEKETYPEGADLLILPYQGSDHLEPIADEIIARLKPKKIMLSHFDNAFPPISRDVDTTGLRKLMAEKYPEIPVVKPTAGKPVVLR